MKVYCSSCGRPITRNQYYCPYCGAKNERYRPEYIGLLGFMQQHGFLFSVCEWTLLLVFNYTTGVSGDLLLILMVPNLIITALYMKIHRVYGALLTILGVLMILENF